MAGVAAIAWFALGLQLYLTITTSLANGLAIPGVLVNYFSFFTILINLLVALTLTISLFWVASAWGRFFSHATVQTGVAIYIALVGTIYWLLLRHLWSLVGMQKLADVLLHDVVPVAYVLYWLIFVPKAGLRWKDALLWLVYPVVYMIYTLIHGAISGWYPYPFIDVGMLGFPHALGNGFLILLAFFVLGIVVIAIGRWLDRLNRPRTAQYR